MTASWPTAAVGDIARLHVLASGLPGTVVLERTLDAPFDCVWGWVSDLERSVPVFDRDVASISVRHRDGEHLRIVARSARRLGGLPLAFDVELRDGWCWMVARTGIYVVGMAAEADGDRTRFAHLEGVALPAPLWLRPAVAPLLALSRWRHRRHMEHDLDGIAAGVTRDERA